MKTKTTPKRLLSMLLALMMVLAMLPTTAFALTALNEIKITGIDEPVVGATWDRFFTATGNGIALTQENLLWYVKKADGSWEILAETDKFEAGRSYRAEIVIAPSDNSFFVRAPGDSYGEAYTGNYTVNGQKPTAADKSDAIVLSHDNSTFDYCLFAYFDFGEPKVMAAPVITKQPQPVSIKPGENATFTVVAIGEGLHYQWWGVDAGMPEKLGTDSPTYSMTNVPTDWTGFKFWCVVSNSAGSVTSAKAHLTLSPSGGSYVLPFTDVPTSAWYYESVKGANQMGLINGETATLYKPADNMTYAEAIKLAACMHQLYTEGEVTLTNGVTQWYSTYYEYCLANGIIPAVSSPWEADYDDLLHLADERIARSVFALLFSRALPDEALPAINFIPDDSIPDVDRYEYDEYEDIYKLYRAGIVNGTDAKGTFKPENFIQRSEVAAILIRMMDPSTRVSAPSKLGE